MADVRPEDIGLPVEAMPAQPIGDANSFPVLSTPVELPPPEAPVGHQPADIPQLEQPIPIDGGPPVGQPPAPVAAPPSLHLVPATGTAVDNGTAAPTASPANPDGLMAPSLPRLSQPEQVAEAEANRASLQEEQANQVAAQADAEAQAAQARADEQARQIKEQDTLQTQQRDALIEAKRVRDAAREETKNFKFHSYWSQKTTGQKILGGIANVLGGASYDSGHVNQVTQQINNDIAQDFKRQEEQLKLKQNDALAKSEDVLDLAKQHNEDWNKLKFRQGEQLQVVGAQFDVMANKAKGAQKVLEARQLAQQYRAAGVALVQNTEENIAKQHLTVAQTREAYARANEANALAAFHRTAGTGAKADKANAADDSAVQKAVAAFDKQHNLSGEKGLGKTLTELSSAYDEARAPVQNPLTQLTILDKVIRSATGLGVRQQALKTYMDHLGGLRAKGENYAQQWVNGTVGKRAWKNVVDHIGSALSEKEKEAGEKNKLFQKVFKGDAALPQAKRRQDTVGALETGLFGGMPGFGVPQGTAQAAPQGRPFEYKGVKGTLAPDGTFTPNQ